MFLYVVCALLLAVYAGSTILFLFIYWRYRRHVLQTPAISEWPTIVVQLPIYNEQYVVRRLLESVAALDYPRDRLTIQLLDDSTDDTSQIATECITRLRETGLNIHHIRRKQRTGYKAGALAYGLSLTDAELVLVLDADFVPSPDFLRRTVPFLAADQKLGMVQTRWGHLNTFTNLLTWSQTLALDSHFVIEQTARSRAGLLMSFNGSGGVWRTACIRAAGGWRDLTLTEDLDLSYRAQLIGWRFLYLPDIVIPAELPPQMAAYKQQQARWARGSTQTLTYMLFPLWRSHFTLIQRFMATLHLCQYLPHPLMLILLLLTPPMLNLRVLDDVPLGLLGLVGLAPPLVYVFSQQQLYPDWKRRLLVFPVLLALGTGIAWNNSRAAINGLLRRGGEFRRTPKFAVGWQKSSYALRSDPNAWIELALALYALWGVVLALQTRNAAVAPYLCLYVFAFGLVGGWSLRDGWQLKRKGRVS
ncbi:MAG: glycosyltransferase [Chloroflexi bacterium]|nr:glycosyltransferase [Chloroflexota bacterium]